MRLPGSMIAPAFAACVALGLGCSTGPRNSAQTQYAVTDPLPAKAEEMSSSVPMLHGRVVSESGEPILSLLLDGERISTPDGSFHLKSGRGGRHTFVVLAPGYASTTFHATVSPELDTDVGRVVVKRGRVIHGQVLDLSTHHPVPGALIDVSNTPIKEEHETQLFEEYGAAKSDTDGNFTLQAEEGPPSLVIDEEHHIQKWLKLDSGPLTLSIELDAGGTVEGHVSEAYAKDTEVIFTRDDGAITRQSCVTNARYSLDRVPKGTYYLTVWSTKGQHLHPLHEAMTLRHDGHQKLVFNF